MSLCSSVSLTAWGRVRSRRVLLSPQISAAQLHREIFTGSFAYIAQEEGKSPPPALVHILPSRVVIFRQ